MNVDDLMRDYLNQQAISSLLAGHVRILGKQDSDDMTSFQVNFKSNSLAFVIPESSRRVFLEKIIQALALISDCESHKTLRKLDLVKKKLHKYSKEFNIL